MRWTKNCNKAYEQLKEYLTTPPILSKPLKREKLFLYLVVSPVTKSLVLLHKNNKIQRPVYYTGRAFIDAEMHYLKTKKLVLLLVVASR